MNLLNGLNSHPFLKGKWVLNDIQFAPEDLTKKLLPVLQVNSELKEIPAEDYGKKLVEECREQISKVPPLNRSEVEFLNLLLDKGNIKPELLTIDSELQKKIFSHPLLHWKALNVRKHRGITTENKESL